jgi:hypothetical protein
MQPYIFPYLGYFQLIQSVNTFVFYDDVNYIKGGWINRNNIWNNGLAMKFSVPLVAPSQNKWIKETLVNKVEYAAWKKKFLKTIEYNYKNAPFYPEALIILQSTLEQAEDNECSIARLAMHSIETVCGYLEMPQKFLVSSDLDEPFSGIDRADRLIAITKSLGDNHYINAQGGIELYSKPYFSSKGVKLEFVKPYLPCYNPGGRIYIPGLSIIDLIMNLNKAELRTMFCSYEII